MTENTVTHRPIFISPIPPIPYSLFSKTFLPIPHSLAIFWNRKSRALACRTPATDVPGSPAATLGEGQRQGSAIDPKLWPASGLANTGVHGGLLNNLTGLGPAKQSRDQTKRTSIVQPSRAERRTASGDAMSIRL